MPDKNKVIIFSAPSGAGKSTITRHLLKVFPRLEFSVSATSRAPRGEERDGVDYHFISLDEFRRRVTVGDFVEWEEVYHGACYGTLRSEMERIWAAGHVIVFDIDVKGGINLKGLFGERALSIFVMPPSLEALRARLEARGEDTPEQIERRLSKAQFEMTDAPQFDFVLHNDTLCDALRDAEQVVGEFIR